MNKTQKVLGAVFLQGAMLGAMAGKADAGILEDFFNIGYGVPDSAIQAMPKEPLTAHVIIRNPMQDIKEILSIPVESPAECLEVSRDKLKSASKDSDAYCVAGNNEIRLAVSYNEAIVWKKPETWERPNTAPLHGVILVP